ncbi:hypothetical protein [Pseudomonas sp. S9]|uniref:hypothetical protein n=1 Tax=Pseudomonas sp. S9 TaxID=686578 RepID=UPI001300C0E0|nr:hypothetical protein [Pseudomonas sp. S9]
MTKKTLDLAICLAIWRQGESPDVNMSDQQAGISQKQTMMLRGFTAQAKEESNI